MLAVRGYLGAHRRRDILNTGTKRKELDLLFSFALPISYIPAANSILSVVHFVSLLQYYATLCQILRFGIIIKKGKVSPVTGREGPQGYETSRLPHFL
jgi:hypothetical protein